MIFKPNSAIVRSYVILILAEKMTYEEVPNLFNLREAVQEALEI
ncbi:CD1375 family protein [Tissierella sp. P1]|nr:CD1375 family protein [Tissierella sp. P1]